jgi:hypothetical protein
LILNFLGCSHIGYCISQMFDCAFEIFDFCLEVSLSDEKGCSTEDIFLDFFPVIESIDEVRNSFLEFLSSPSEVVPANS